MTLLDLVERQAARIQILENALQECIEDLQSWGAYADEYYQQKWDLAGDIAAVRRALEGDSR